jgi:hypothetical protein
VGIEIEAIQRRRRLRRTVDGTTEFTEHAEPAGRHPRRSAGGLDDLDLAVARHHGAAPRPGTGRRSARAAMP